MKTIKILLISMITLASLTLVSCGKANVDSNGCYSDFDEANKVANKKNQDMLIFVTMNGDDAYSQSFTDTIIRNEKFKDEIASKYVVVRMDFSKSSYEATVAAEDANDTAKKNAEKRADMMQRNTNFANLLNVTVTPITYLFSKEKYLITSLYYDSAEKSYEEFKYLLDSKADAISEMHKMIYQTKIGTPEEKMSAINDLYEATAPDARHFLVDLLSSTKKIDPSNKSGLLGKLIYAAADAKSIIGMNKGDARYAVDAYLALENEDSVAPYEKQQAIYTAAYLCSMTELEDLSVVIGYLNKAISIYPESEEVPAIQHVIEALTANGQ